MGVVSIKELLEAGVHFGHQTNRWNPKMKKFLFGERNGIYIIDLQQTVARMEHAYAFVRDTVASGQSVLFAGTKLYERGKRNEALWTYIGRNSRAARQLQDDLDAQIASARLGAKRFVELMDRYGRQMVLDATQQLMDYTERVLRQRIAAIPDGEYRAEGFLDDDGKNRDVRLPIKVCVRVKGDKPQKLTFLFGGSDLDWF